MTKSEKEEHVAIFLILSATLILFRNVIQFDFVWDDIALISRNPYLAQPLHFFEIFKSDFWKFSSIDILMQSYYRPMVTLAYMIEYKVFGLFAGGYHSVNLLLHLLNIVLIWRLGFRFELSKVGRIISTLLFAFHPVQVSTVCFISCHGDLLATFFSLLAIHFWFFEKPIRWMALLWMLLAMLSKEAAVILPVVIFFLDWLVKNKKLSELEKFIPMGVWVFYFILRHYGLQNTNFIWESSRPIWASFGSYRTFLFMGRIFFPIPIAPEEDGMPEIGLYKTILFHFIYLALIYISFVKTKNNSKLRFFMIWFFLSTLLIADWFNLNLRFSDQLLYYPLLPLSLLLGYLITFRNKIFYVVSAILIIFTCISATQVKYWRNNVALWSNAFQKNPENPFYSLSYGAALQDIGHQKDGCALIQYTLKITKKETPPSFLTLVLLYLGNCNFAEHPTVAEGYYRKSIEVYENNYTSRKNLIQSLINQNKNQEALDQAKILIQKSPEDKGSWLILGDALKVNGMSSESQQAYKKADELHETM